MKVPTLYKLRYNTCHGGIDYVMEPDYDEAKTANGHNRIYKRAADTVYDRGRIDMS